MNVPSRSALFMISGISMLLFAGTALIQGYSIDWDVLNYHYYNGFAFLHGRTWHNLQAGMRQSYFFPLLDAGFALLVRVLPAALVAVALALVQSLALPLLFLIAHETCAPAAGSRRRGIAIAGLLALFGAACPGEILELGGPSGDTLAAIPLLAGLLAALRGRPALAGAMAGVAAGLKLTAAPFALGILGAAAAQTFMAQPLARAWRNLLVSSTVALTAFLTLYGPWAALLWRHFGNPFFPSFNNLFRSPWAAPMSYVDPAFAVRGWRDAMLYPYARLTLLGQPDPTGPFDLRLGLALPLACLALARLAVTPSRHAAARPVLVFTILAYSGWLATFAVNRYAVVLELLAPLVIMLSLQALVPSPLAASLLAIACFAAIVGSAARNAPLYWIPWLHAHADGRGYFATDFQLPVALANGGTVAVLSQYPASFVIPQFSRNIEFVRLQGSLYFDAPHYLQLLLYPSAPARRAVFGNALGKAICARLHGNEPLYALRATNGLDRTDVQALLYYGLDVNSRACVPVRSRTPFAQLELCPAQLLPYPECRAP